MTLGTIPHDTGRPPKRNKYRAVKVTVDGFKFDSKAEARRPKKKRASK